MKLQHIILAGLAIAMVATSCKESRINPGDKEYNQDTIHVAPPMPDPKAAEEVLKTLDSSLVLTVAQARDTCRALASGATTAIEYYVKGWICSVDGKDDIEEFGNATFYVGVSYLSGIRHAFEAYRVKGKDNKRIVSADAINVGDFVILKSKLKNYNGVAETSDNAYIYYSTNPEWDPQMDTTKVTPDPAGVDVPAGTLNVYQAIKIGEGLGTGNTSSETYYIKGWVVKADAINESEFQQFGSRTFYITPTNDGTTNAFQFEGYRVKGANNAKFTNANQLEVGDFVVIKSKIYNYKGTIETSGGFVYSSSNANFNAAFNK